MAPLNEVQAIKGSVYSKVPINIHQPAGSVRLPRAFKDHTAWLWSFMFLLGALPGGSCPYAPLSGPLEAGSAIAFVHLSLSTMRVQAWSLTQTPPSFMNHLASHLYMGLKGDRDTTNLMVYHHFSDWSFLYKSDGVPKWYVCWRRKFYESVFFGVPMFRQPCRKTAGTATGPGALPPFDLAKRRPTARRKPGPHGWRKIIW